MTREEVIEKVTAIFVEYGEVPEGYDFEMWSKEDWFDCKTKWRDAPEWQRSWEEVVRDSIENMVGK